MRNWSRAYFRYSGLVELIIYRDQDRGTYSVDVTDVMRELGHVHVPTIGVSPGLRRQQEVDAAAREAIRFAADYHDRSFDAFATKDAKGKYKLSLDYKGD